MTVHSPMLTSLERAAINNGRWFASLSPTLKHEIFRYAYTRHCRHGEQIATRGTPSEAWIACAKGAIRVSSTTPSKKQTTLTYLAPGIWFGGVSMLNGEGSTHDAYAHGATTLMCVSKADLTNILAQHTELYEALIRLHARRIRDLYSLIEDLNTLPLRARLAKQLLHLMRHYGAIPLDQGNEVRIGLRLAQSGLAQWLGASRGRVNLELKVLERANVIRFHQGAMVICNHFALQQMVAATD
jgi:CRP/FNR family cyclic AMP-dependent transcriptional regulator